MPEKYVILAAILAVPLVCGLSMLRTRFNGRCRKPLLKDFDFEKFKTLERRSRLR